VLPTPRTCSPASTKIERPSARPSTGRASHTSLATQSAGDVKPGDVLPGPGHWSAFLPSVAISLDSSRGLNRLPFRRAISAPVHLRFPPRGIFYPARSTSNVSCHLSVHSELAWRSDCESAHRSVPSTLGPNAIHQGVLRDSYQVARPTDDIAGRWSGLQTCGSDPNARASAAQSFASIHTHDSGLTASLEIVAPLPVRQVNRMSMGPFAYWQRQVNAWAT
jgi:hypothetical protein